MTNLTREQVELLEKAHRAVEYRQRIDDELTKLIYRLWLTGASWGHIGRLVGTSRQAAQATWSKRVMAMHAGT